MQTDLTALLAFEAPEKAAETFDDLEGPGVGWLADHFESKPS